MESLNFNDEDSFLEYIFNAITSNKLVLPSLPEVALKVRDAVAKGDAGAAALAKIIAADVAIAARLIQVVNSPLYRTQQKIDNLQYAISRLGYSTVRTLVTSLIMQQLFKPKSTLLTHHFQQAWEHSVNVSSLSRALCSLCHHLDPEQAMLAGLIHQIGKLPILSLAEKTPALANDEALLDDVLEKHHATIGQMIMLAWNFPESLSRVVSDYRHFQRDPFAQADYVDVVQVAFLETIMGSEHPLANIDLSTVTAFSKLGLSEDIEVLEIEGISEQAEQTRQLLH